MTVSNPPPSAPSSPINLVTIAASVALANKLLAADANNAFQVLGSGEIDFGPGGAAALDTAIKRSAAGQVRVGTGASANDITLAQAVISTLSGNTVAVGTGGGGTYLTLSGNLLTMNKGAVVPVGQNLAVGEGANARMGTATLVAGTVTVSNTSVTANTRIFLTCLTPGGTPGFLRVSAVTAATSFTILSSNAADTSIVSWLLIEAA